MKQGYRILMLVAYLTIIFYLLTKPINHIPSFLSKWNLPFPIDKAVHFCLFIPLAFLTWICTFEHKIYIRIISSIFFCIFIAFITEFVQYFIPYRSYDIMDAYTDMYGATTGLIVSLIIYYITREKHTI